MNGSRLVNTLLCIGVCILWSACEKSTKSGAPHEVPKVPIKIAVAKTLTIADSLEITGVAQAEVQQQIVSEIGGRILNMRFIKGTAIHAGDTIIVLDTTAQSLSLRRAKASFQKAVTDYERTKLLSQGGGATAQQLQDASFVMEQAKIAVADAERVLGLSFIRSPITGIAISRPYDLGSVVSPGSIITEIINLSQLKVLGRVPEFYAYQIHNGDPVLISCNSLPNVSWNGTISFISPSADKSNNFPFEVRFKNSGLNPIMAGSMLQLKIPRIKMAHVAVPRESIIGSMEEPYVWKLHNGAAQKVSLSIGWNSDEYVQVIKGIAIGDSVVTAGANNLRLGDQVVEIK